MKAKLTVTIDEELIPKAKRYARKRGLSVSELIETSLRAVTEEPEGTTFSQRWRGKFQPAEREDERYQALAKRYL
jgi:post-segregation antitoxin (ccd killing protein)